MKIKSKKNILVTGGAGFIGFHLTKQLLKKNFSVFGIDNINNYYDENLKLNRLGELKSFENFNFLKVDISDVELLHKAFDVAREQNGQERICINCAGIAPAQKTVTNGFGHDPELFSRVINTNLIGCFNVASYSAAGMSQAKILNENGERGVIINTASIAAFEGQIGQSAYAASKAGIVGMTLPMARDLAVHGIRVMSIAPGIFSTPMLKNLSAEVQESLSESIPFPSRLGCPSEYADLVIHILGNPMLNGENIRLDGAVRLSKK